jgi:predicted lipid-binding transport protein (Tim44 family)
MGAAGFPIDLVLFGMIAAFLILRLRSILGRRTGFERPADPRAQPASTTEFRGEVIEGHAESVAPPVSNRPVPDADTPLGTTLALMAKEDHAFDAGRFLTGAEAAFRMIVAAFANGDRVTLRGLLGDEMYRAFETAISAREANNQTQRSDIQSVDRVSIEEADLRGSQATISVRFVSDQISVLTGADGLPVAGAEAVTEITDLWTFERDLHSSDPAWRLVAARSA